MGIVASESLKDDSLDPLDFVIKTMVKHEKAIDKMVSDLDAITQKLVKAKELTNRLKDIDNKLLEIKTNLDKRVNITSNKHPPITEKDEVVQSRNTINLSEIIKPPVTIQYKQWEDFRVFALQSQLISYTINDEGKTLQVTAFKDNKTGTYNAYLPKFALLIKSWLSSQLGTIENSIFEGALNLS